MRIRRFFQIVVYPPRVRNAGKWLHGIIMFIGSRKNILNWFIPALQTTEWGYTARAIVVRWQLPDALLLWKSRENA